MEIRKYTNDFWSLSKKTTLENINFFNEGIKEVGICWWASTLCLA